MKTVGWRDTSSTAARLSIRRPGKTRSAIISGISRKIRRSCRPNNWQMKVTFNKKGWHYPQQRFITLWGDVANTLNGTRLPEPFFFRANSHDIIEFWHTDLVPSYYELDDFQVRTPTDIIGQHIHLVKF